MSVIYDPSKHPQPPAPRQQVRAPKPPRRRRPRQPVLSGLRFSPRAIKITFGLVAVMAAIWFGLTALQQPEPSVSNLPNDKELVAPAKVYLSAEHAQAQMPLKLSFVAPKDWRSTRTQSGTIDLLAPTDYRIAAFTFTAGSDTLEQSGDLLIEDATAWASSDMANQLYLNQLTDLRRKRLASDSDAAKIPKIAGERGGRTQVSYVNSADGKLSGLVFATKVKNQDAVMGVLAGPIDGHMVYVRFQLATPDSMKTIPQAAAVLKSLTLDTSASSPQAPAVDK